MRKDGDGEGHKMSSCYTDRGNYFHVKIPSTARDVTSNYEILYMLKLRVYK
jgi:hypothetical protein